MDQSEVSEDRVVPVTGQQQLLTAGGARKGDCLGLPLPDIYTYGSICAVRTQLSTGRFTLEMVFHNSNSAVSETQKIFQFCPRTCR